MHVAEFHKLALHVAERLAGRGKLRECCHDAVGSVGRPLRVLRHILHVRIRETVQLGVSEEEIPRHESKRRSAVILVKPAYLLQTVVITDIESGGVQHHILTDTVVRISRALIHGQGNSRRLVLNHDRLVDISGGITRNHTAMDYIRSLCSLVLHRALHRLISKSGLELRYGGVGFHCCLRLHERGSVHVCLAGSQGSGGCRHRHSKV